jgi:uncharacterized protein (TIGR03435 family)
MRKPLRHFTIAACLAVTAMVAPAQTAPAFEVASVKPSAPLDMLKLAMDIRAGQGPRIGPRVDGARAEYTYMALRDLIVLAYKVKPYQITGPDWIANQRFDIVAKLPDGASKDDAPRMLQTLLEDRFKLAAHRESKEHPVLALVAGKGGPKLKESAEAPQAIDENAPLKPGEVTIDGADGPMRMTPGKNGGATINMGSKGIMSYAMDPATQSMHMEASALTMAGFADMLTQFSQITGGGGRQVVDMTGLKGSYQVALDFSLADLVAMARAAGVDVGAAAGGGAPSAMPADAASDPGGSSSLLRAVESLGLKLETRKAVVDQLVIDHVDKTPTGN